MSNARSPSDDVGGAPVASSSAAPPEGAPLRDVPIDWEALEDAFENNAPEVHSYLQLSSGEVIRVVDGVADPQMHARIAGDPGYLRVDPVSSREQYRWMERFIPMVDDPELRMRLNHAIDGKGAFRRFKDVLMAYAEDRERWFTYRSERLKTFMDAWLTAHNLRAVPRPAWTPPPGEEAPAEPVVVAPPAREPRRRSGEATRTRLRELIEALGPRDVDTLAAFAEFLRARRATRAARAGENEATDDEAPLSTTAEREAAGGGDR